MKFENNNKEVIKRIIKRSLRKNKVRNIFTVIAIILTTFMISSIFSIGISFAKNYKTMNLRLQGNTSTVTLANPTSNQMKKIETLNLLDSMGYEINVGEVVLENLTKNRTSIQIKYSNGENFQKQITPCVSDIKGTYPTGGNQVMASKKALEFLGKADAKIGDVIKIPCRINGQVINKQFILSGYYTTYGVVQDTGYLLVSKKFVKENSLTLESNGKLFATIKQKFKKTAPNVLDKEISLKENQKFLYSYDRTEEFQSTVFMTIVSVVIIALFIVLSGYLLIYNIIYISVTKDINFYGLLKTIGTAPKQIKAIVKGQALRLSAIGILIGLILGAAVSWGIVPLVMRTFFTDSSAMPGDVSFNPLIFIATALFSLLTVILSCRKPAKIASTISPVEALHYIGSIHKKQKESRNSTNGGKLYKMAWYNVFREKKRAVVVFLSLFMGIITFLSVNTFLGSLGVENYINRYVKNDFEIQNVEAKDDKLDSEFINKIKTMKGVNTVSVSKSSVLELKMNEDILLPSLKECYRRYGISEGQLDEYLKKVEENPSLLTASVIGIDDNFIERFNSEAKEKIDTVAFKNGQLAILDSWNYGKNYKDIKGNLIIKNPKSNTLLEFNAEVVKDEKNMLPSGLPAAIGIPTIYLSNSVLEKLDSSAVNCLVDVNVDSKYEEQIETELKNFSSNRGLWFDSKSDKAEEFKSTQRVMNILGGGISIILILIGILNFINVMITGVNVRLKELAIIESIGMTKKQIKKMLAFEGLYYAGITILLILTIGMGIVYGIAELTKRIADYAEFIFPAVPLIILIVFIFAVCLITPTIVFKQSSKSSLTERIREIEN